MYEAELLAGAPTDTEKPRYIQHTAIGLMLLASITPEMDLIERMNYLAFLLDDTNPIKTELLCAIATILLHHDKVEAARGYASSAWHLYTRNVSSRDTEAETCLRDRLVHLDKKLCQVLVFRPPDSEL